MEKRTSSFWVLFVLIFYAVSLTGCDIIGDIFKSGIVVGVIIAIVIIGLLIFILSKAK